MQTQMLFIKDSNGIVIGYTSWNNLDHVKNLGDINSIIKSLTFKPNSQGTGSSGGGNVKNITSDSKQSSTSKQNTLQLLSSSPIVICNREIQNNEIH